MVTTHDQQLQNALQENQQFRARLAEADEALRAIRNGEVDALVMRGSAGEEVYTLRTADHVYRVLIEGMDEGAVVVSEDGLVVYANRRFADLVKRPLQRVITAPFRRFVPIDQQGTLNNLLAGTPDGRVELTVLADDGTSAPAYISASALEMDGRAFRCLIVTDLSEQKRNESIAAANAAKDQFLAMLSHELRTPVGPVVTALHLLQMDAELPDKFRPLLETMQRNIDLESRLIDDCLDLTRISRGKLELHHEIVDVHAVLRSALEISRSDINEKQLEVVTDLRATRHHIWGDPARTQQIFWNILKNAAKFTPAKGSIRVATCDADQGAMAISIRDSGIGIEPAVMQRIFNPFEQGERDTTRKFGGLGLGLSITKALVEMLGGRIHAASEGRNKGSCFTVNLPCVPAPSPPTATQSAPSAVPRRTLSILLVDDHPDSLLMTSKVLGTFGHEVHCAKTVAAALAAAAERPFDLLISDIGLPDASGYELMARLKSIRPLQGIALTGYGMESDQRRSKDVGFMAHLTKPVSIPALDAAIQKAALMLG